MRSDFSDKLDVVHARITELERTVNTATGFISGVKWVFGAGGLFGVAVVLKKIGLGDFVPPSWLS